MILTILNIVIHMLNNNDTSLQADLRKKTTIIEEIKYSDYDFQSCMVMLVVITALLLSVISVVVAKNPCIV